jgi:glycerol kinase
VHVADGGSADGGSARRVNVTPAFVGLRAPRWIADGVAAAA